MASAGLRTAPRARIIQSSTLALRRPLLGARLLSTRTAPLLLQTSSPLRRAPAHPPLARPFSWSWRSKPPADPTVLTPEPATATVLAPQPASAAPAVQTTFDATDATASAVAAPPPLAPAPAADLAASAIPPPADLSAAPSLPGVEALLSDVPALLEPGALSALGLSHGFPSGWATAALDYLHLTLALSWPGTILAACVLARAPLAVLQVSSLRTSARLQQFARPLDALRTEASAARARGDRIRMQLAALRYQKLQERTGVGYAGVLKIAGVGIVNIPVTLGLFLAVRRLAGLPLPEMAASAWAWIPSLTAPDPLYLLPLANAFIMQLSLSLNKLDSTTASGAHLLNAMRVVSVAGAGWLCTQSAAVNLLVLTQAALLALQTFLLRAPGIRRMLAIPVVPRDQVFNPSMRESATAGREWIAGLADQAKQDAVRK